MQDLIQLNAAIYRLNVACASPANRSHMTGTLRAKQQQQQQKRKQQQQHPPAPEKSLSDTVLGLTSMAQQFSLPGSLSSAASNSQILSQPLQPLRPPRPSWTVRRDDLQPTYARQQVQLTTNGMVAVPRVRPTPAPLPPLLAPQHQPPVMSAAGAAVKPLDPAQQLLNTQKEAGTVHPVPFSINTGLLPVSDQQQQQQQALSRQWASQQRTGSGASPQSPYRDGQNSADRALRYAGSSTYRSRNSAHVDFDELHLVRPA
ncbi:hypothetical protein GGF37_003170, partial [Kickxella alabastrina]